MKPIHILRRALVALTPAYSSDCHRRNRHSLGLKKSSGLFLLTFTLALLLIGTDSAFARSSSGRGRGSVRPPPIKIHAGGETISKVGSFSIEVKSGTGTRSYGIDGRTAVLIGGRTSSVGVLQNGMRVSMRARTSDPSMAESITVNDLSIRTAPPVASKTPSKAKTPSKGKRR